MADGGRAPQVFDPDEPAAGHQLFDPDEPAPPPRKPGFFEGTGAAIEQAYGRAAGTVARGVGLAASTLARGAETEAAAQQQNDSIARGIDIGSGNAAAYPDDTLSQAIIGASDRLAKRTEEYWEPKQGQKIGLGAKIAAGVASVGTFPLTAGLSPAERAAEIVRAGGSLEDAYKAAGTDAAFNAAMVLVGGGAGTALTKAGAGPVASAVGGAAVGAGINVGLSAAQPAVEAAVAPGIPEEAKMQQPGAEELTVAGLVGAAAGAHGARGERAAELQRQMQERIKARPDWEQLSPADQMRVVSGQVPQADQAKAAARAHGIDVEHIEAAPPPRTEEDTMRDMAAAARRGGIQEIEGAPAPEGGGRVGIDEWTRAREVEQVKGAPAPKEEAAPTGGEPRQPEEQIAAGPVKSERQVELERLREQAATPEAQAHVDKLIAAEEKAQQKAFDAEEKSRQGEAGAAELRRLAGQTPDTDLKGELLARAEKLSPTMLPEAPGGKTEEVSPVPAKPAAQPAVEAAPAPRQHTVGSSPFFQKIVDELGGIHSSEIGETGLEAGRETRQAISKTGKPFQRTVLRPILMGGKSPNGKARGPLFNGKGATMDRVVEWLHSAGYLTDADIAHADESRTGGSHELARDMLQRERANPGSVVPIRDESDRWEGVAERQRQDELVMEAERLGIEHRGRTLESVERDVAAAQDHQHATDHGHEPEHLENLADVRRAADIDEGAVERLAMQHGEDVAGFNATIKEFLNAHERSKPAPERAGAEPRSGGPAEQPAVRGEHQAAAAMAAGRDAIRGEQGLGEPGPGERPGGRPEVPGPGPERGGAAAAETGAAVEEPFPDVGERPPREPPDLTGWDQDRLQRMSDLTGRRIKEEQAKLAELEARAKVRSTGESRAYAIDRSRDRVAGMTEDKAHIDAELARRAPAAAPAPQAEPREKIVERAKASLTSHVERIKAYLDRQGLGWVHRGVDYGVDDDIHGVAQVRMKGGRYKLDVTTDLMAEHRNVIDQAMLHEHGHIIDWSGQLYSADPALEVGHDANGKIVPVGSVAKELFALAKSNADMGKLMRYPMDDAFEALHQSKAEFESELFAQAIVAYHTPLREVMKNEAPQAAEFLARALAHASEHGEVPHGGPAGEAKLAELRSSFDASRPAGGLQQRGAGEPVPGLTEKLEQPLKAQRAADADELKNYRQILARSYTQDQLKRMGEASKEEDAMLKSGKYEQGKGLNSLPPDQKEVMEFLQGRGYNRRILPYTPYQGVAQRTDRGGEGGLGDSIRKVFAPASRGGFAEEQAGIMRHNFALQATEKELALKKLQSYADRYDKMTPAKAVAFTDAVERGRMLPPSQMADDAKVLRSFYDAKTKQVQDLGTGALEHFNENYVGHAWTEPERATQDLYAIKRPLEGSKAFLKKRTIPYTTDGLRWRAYDKDGDFIKSFDTEGEAKEAMPDGGRVGKPLTPITYNPFEMALIKGREMDRYIYGQRIMGEMKSNGMGLFVPYGTNAPAGWSRINDKIAKAVEQTPGGPVKRGEYYAPEEAATLLNNHLSPGFRGHGLYEVIRSTGNMMNQAQLGLSFFHVGFTAADSMISRIALGNKQISRGIGQGDAGDVVKGFGNILMGLSPHQPFENLYKGDKFLKAIIGEDPDNPLVEAFHQAGGRIRQDDFYRNVEVNAFKNAMKSGQWLTAATKAVPTALDKIGAPIFQWLVPRQKLGVFADMAKDWLAKNPDADLATRRTELGKMWDSVDNRMGQLVYDNLFWNKALKDSLMVSVRSVGWNLGTIRELGGGLVDVKDIAKNRQLSDRTAYVIALPFMTAIYGAITQYLYAGEGPQEMKDYFFPRTGRTRPDGSADRVSLPTYMKDVAAYGKDVSGAIRYGADPFATLENKLHPILSTIAQMVSNKDFFGAAIRNPADPGVRQATDEAQYLLKQMEPFAMRNYQQQENVQGAKPDNALESLGRYMTAPSMYGITPSPGYITKGDEQEKQAEIGRLREPLMRKFREEIRDGAQVDQAMVKRMSQSGLSKRDIEYVVRSSGSRPMPHRQRSFGVTP